MLSLQDVLELAFSIVHDVEEYCLNFVAPTRYEVSSRGLQGWHTVPEMSLPGDSSQGSELCVSLGVGGHSRGEMSSLAAQGWCQRCPCSASPVLPLDGWAECASGQGDDK